MSNVIKLRPKASPRKRFEELMAGHFESGEDIAALREASAPPTLPLDAGGADDSVGGLVDVGGDDVHVVGADAER